MKLEIEIDPALIVELADAVHKDGQTIDQAVTLAITSWLQGRKLAAVVREKVMGFVVKVTAGKEREEPKVATDEDEMMN